MTHAKNGEEFWRVGEEFEPLVVDDPERELITPAQAADILGVSRPTVTGFMDRGTFTVVWRSTSGRRWLLRKEVEAYLNSPRRRKRKQ